MSLISKIKRFYKRAYTMGHFPSTVKTLLSKKEVFIYYGYLGDYNFGDELVFEATTELFKNSILIPVRRQMPVTLRLLIKYRKDRISGIIIGGGTLVGPFWESEFFLGFKQLGLGVFMHGTGVHKKIDAKENWEYMTSPIFFGGVRGNISQKNFKARELKVIGDAAFYLFDKKLFSPSPRSKRVLLNLGTHEPYLGQSNARQELEKFMTYLISKDYSLTFLAFHEIDYKLGQKLKVKYPSLSIETRYKDFQDCAELFHKHCFAIGERLHFTVMAAMTRTPFLSINYAKKHEDLLDSLSLSSAGFVPEELDTLKVIDFFERKAQFDWDLLCQQFISFGEIQKSEANSFLKKIK